MKRRTFVKNSTLTAFSIAAFGTVHWNGKSFIGNNPTTTDILGPFYRPGSPMRSNLIPPGSKGEPLHLSGTILQQDGQTPLSNVLIEAWQCDENEYYDNTSDDYLFRGAVKTTREGKYSFETIVPVPYKASATSWRPAHIHLRVSSPNHQDLITQIYFKGDPYLDQDSSSASPQAVNRILDITTNAANPQKVVNFDVVMDKAIPLDNSVYDKICGLYSLDNGMAEFYREDDLLFVKLNGHIKEGLVYQGDNTFEGALGLLKAKFELLRDGGTKATIYRGDFENPAKVQTSKGTKFLKYR